MANRRLIPLWFLLCCFLPMVNVPRISAQGTSTPEERTQWVEIAHKLEATPLDDNVNQQGEVALKRLSDVHDIHVPLCPTLLGEFNDAKYKYRHEVTRQYMLASGAFIIENPDKTADTKAMNLAAVGSALKVYSAILLQRQDAKWKALDDLLKKQTQGKLEDGLPKECK